ncbi:MAG: hypothetical protein AB7U61_04595 [Methylocystis sp.]
MSDESTTEAERAAALVEIGASAAHELISNIERDVGAADAVGVLSGVIDACACFIAAAAGPENAVDTLNDIGGSLADRLRDATKAGH